MLLIMPPNNWDKQLRIEFNEIIEQELKQGNNLLPCFVLLFRLNNKQKFCFVVTCRNGKNFEPIRTNQKINLVDLITTIKIAVPIGVELSKLQISESIKRIVNQTRIKNHEVKKRI